jgi:hypothetical protein
MTSFTLHSASARFGKVMFLAKVALLDRETLRLNGVGTVTKWRNVAAMGDGDLIAMSDGTTCGNNRQLHNPANVCK